MRRFVEDYVRTCDTCCRAKMPRKHPYGLLEPLPLPSKPWQSISLDFITDLPVSKGFDAILTIVDRYTKMAHSYLVLRKSLVKKPPKLSCVRYFGIMASSSMVCARNSGVTYKSSCRRSFGAVTQDTIRSIYSFTSSSTTTEDLCGSSLASILF